MIKLHQTTTVILTALVSAFLLSSANSNSPKKEWSPSGEMAVGRAGACSVALADGRVLVIGGRSSEGGVMPNADLLGDHDIFTAVAPMANSRSGHSCSLLPNGSVLVAGGASNSGALNVVEIYSPDTDKWSYGPDMMAARTGHTATVLKDGRVLIAGGESAGLPSDSLEIFSPETGAFTPTAARMSSLRKEHAAAML